MMNRLGKILVLLHVTLSLLAVTWAGALLLQFIDWGWKQPRLDVSERVPSEIDKRIVAVNDAIRARNLALAPIKASQDALYDAMDRYADNHLFQRDELARLRTAGGAVEVKEVKFQDGKLVLTKTPFSPRTGQPVLDQKLDDIDKSLVQYEEILGVWDGKNGPMKKVSDLTDAELEAVLAKRRETAKGLTKKIAELTDEQREWTKKAQTVTKLLGGVDDAGVKVKIGLYDLLELEAQTQARIQFEKTYLQPQWAEAVEEAQKSIERRQRLQETLDRLEKDLGIIEKK